MALYHLTTKPIPRRRGAARRRRRRTARRRGPRHSTGETWDYTRKQGVEHSEIVLPTAAAQRDINWARDREQLWNAAEMAEKRMDARVAREWEVALPHELTQGQRVDLAREFAGEIANRYGCAVDVASTGRTGWGSTGTPRAPDGDHPDDRAGRAWARKPTSSSATGTGPRRGSSAGRTRSRTCGRGGRSSPTSGCRNLGFRARIDHRTLKAQGIEREPTVHLGPSVTGMERRGIETEVGNRVREEQRQELQLKLEKAAGARAARARGAARSRNRSWISPGISGRRSRSGTSGWRSRNPGPARHDPFAGLTLGVGAAGPKKDPFEGLQLSVDRSPKPSIERDTTLLKDQELNLALDRYGKAWSDMARMPEQGLPVLEHQVVELRKAGEELDRLRPEATKDLSAAFTFEPSVRQSMVTLEGPERAQKLFAALEHEERLRQNPEARAERVVKVWKELEQRHGKLYSVEHTEARQGIEQQLRHLAAEIKRDGPLGRSLQERSRSLGIEMGSPLDRVLRARTLERALELSLPSRSRGLELRDVESGAGRRCE